MTMRTKKVLFVIIAIILAILVGFIVCKYIIPALFNLFVKVVVIIAIIVCGCLALNS